jgi:hypothetical protein
MRNFTLGLLALFCALGTVQKAEAQIGSVCSSTISLPDGRFIYKNSAPLRNSRGVMIGLRYEPTLIMNSSAYSSRGGTTLYDSNGNKVGTCPWASAHGFSGGRFRCTMKTSSLRRAVVKSSKNPAVFIKYKGSACVKVPDAGRCYGSVKGGCNRLIS